jgi:hypothetical protein
LTATVIPDVKACRDIFSAGESGAGGLSGYLHKHFRGKKKSATDGGEKQPQETPEFLLDNPFYTIRRNQDGAKKKAKKATCLVPVAVRDICGDLLRNENLCGEGGMFELIAPLLQVYLILTGLLLQNVSAVSRC